MRDVGASKPEARERGPSNISLEFFDRMLKHVKKCPLIKRMQHFQHKVAKTISFPNQEGMLNRTP